MLRTTTLALALSALALSASAQTNPAEHAAHHPASAPASASTSAPAASVSQPADRMVKMEAQMKTMRAMHDKMMAARSPQERQALMAG